MQYGNCRIGVVLHGPEIIDGGCALKLIRYIQRRGKVTAVLGGTMGRVALMDAGLQDTVRISPRRRPSQSIQDLKESSDIIFLLNLAKSRESGLSFGAMVARAAGEGRPLIQIDCGGRFISLLRGDEEAAILACRLAFELGLDLIRPRPMGETGKEDERGIISRTLNAVCPGELISVNGTVIGRAVENHPFFPERTNVSFVRVLGRDHIKIKIWERGVGITTSSGTGSCGAGVAAIRKGYTDSSLVVESDTGRQIVEWQDGSPIKLVGDVAFVAEIKTR